MADDLRPFLHRPRPTWADVPWHGGASFIWHPDESLYFEQPRHSVCAFRQDLELPAPVVGGELRLAADSRYRLWIDGRPILRGPLRSDPRFFQYDLLDPSPVFHAGHNRIAALVIHHGYGTGAQASLRPGFLLHADLELADGSRAGFHTDGDWLCWLARGFDRRAPRLNGRLGPVEAWDCRALDPEWTTRLPGADWVNAVATAPVSQRENGPWHRLIPADIPPLVQGRQGPTGAWWLDRCPMPPPALAEFLAPRPGLVTAGGGDGSPLGRDLSLAGRDAAVVVTLQLPQAWFGWPSLTVHAPAGTTLDCFVFEELDRDRIFLPGTAYGDRFRLRGGRNQLETQFTGKTGRWIQLWLWGEGLVRLEDVALDTAWYPYAETTPIGGLTKPWPQVLAVAEHTLRLCAQDGILDSPSREQQQWMGDGRRQAWTAALRFGDTRPWRRLLDQIRQSQDPLGALFPRHPGRHENVKPIPMFMLDWVLSLDEYHRVTGDRDFVADCWLNLLGVLRWFSGFIDVHGLPRDVPGWWFIDWGREQMPDYRRGGVVTPLACAWIGALRATAGLARLLDQQATAKECIEQALQAEAALLPLAWDDHRGAFVDCVTANGKSRGVSEPTNIQALLHLDLDEARRHRVVEEVFAGAQVGIEGCSPAYVLDLGRALGRCGRLDLALSLLAPRYQALLDAGATTLWENWWLVRERPDGHRHQGSASHGWGAGIIAVFLETATGLVITEPGFARCRLAPDWRTVPRFQATIHTPHGRLQVRWTSDTSGCDLALVPPDGLVVAIAGYEIAGGERVDVRLDTVEEPA